MLCVETATWCSIMTALARMHRRLAMSSSAISKGSEHTYVGWLEKYINTMRPSKT